MSIASVLKWDAAPNVLAWKFPSEELGTWSQLIVAESQEAVLVKEGQFVGPFTAGRHVLSTENYPVLRDLFRIPFGRSPFTAEVWFVQRTYMLDVRWGTSDPILLKDPQYNIMLPIRAFGQYGIQIEDSRMFLQKLVGTLPAFTVSTLTQHFKGIILSVAKSAIAKYLIQKEIPLLQISMYLEEISEHLQEALQNKLGMYGVKLTNFAVASINTDESDPAVARLRRALAERAEMDIVGFNYQQRRSFDVMETAAGNEGAGAMQAGMLGAGVGMGLGVGLGQNMSTQMSQVNQSTLPGSFCPKCGAAVPPGSKFCTQCGQSLQSPAGVTCPQCHTVSPAGTRFCSHCGHQL